MSLLDYVDKILKEANLKLERHNVKRVKPSREGLMEYDYFPIIRDDATKVGDFVIDSYETSVSSITLLIATQAEELVIKKAEKSVEDLNSEIGE